MGLSLAVTCAAEAAVFHYIPQLLAALGVRRCLHLVFAAFLARLACYAALPAWGTPWAVLPVELLHGLTFALAWGAGSAHCAATLAPPGLEATTQGLFQGESGGEGRGRWRGVPSAPGCLPHPPPRPPTPRHTHTRLRRNVLWRRVWHGRACGGAGVPHARRASSLRLCRRRAGRRVGSVLCGAAAAGRHALGAALAGARAAAWGQRAGGAGRAAAAASATAAVDAGGRARRAARPLSLSLLFRFRSLSQSLIRRVRLQPHAPPSLSCHQISTPPTGCCRARRRRGSPGAPWRCPPRAPVAQSRRCAARRAGAGGGWASRQRARRARRRPARRHPRCSWGSAQGGGRGGRRQQQG